jgi:endonuclease YncB( thermonuclease family)
MIRFLLIIIFVLAPSISVAQMSVQLEPDTEKPSIEMPIPDFSSKVSGAKHTKSGRIDKIIDSLTIELKDGTIVRLASVNIPDFHIYEDAPYSEKALKFLKEKLSEGTEVMLYQTRNRKKGRINRMEQQLAHVVVKGSESENKTWIQGQLIREGLAYVHMASNNHLMLNDLYLAEDIARKEEKGIWAEDSLYRVVTPEQASDKIGDFAVIEGVVEKVATVRNNIYLNFGKDWKTDFTIQVPPATRKQFAKQGLNALNMAGQKIRVRGYLREYNGPLIELKNSAHFEVVSVDEVEGDTAREDNQE